MRIGGRAAGGLALGLHLQIDADPFAQHPVAFNILESYDHVMAKVKKFDLDDTSPTVDGEDEETLAAIDEGIRDSAAGRTRPSEDVRKLLPKWISASSTRKER
jgi:hypothetical protein